MKIGDTLVRDMTRDNDSAQRAAEWKAGDVMSSDDAIKDCVAEPELKAPKLPLWSFISAAWRGTTACDSSGALGVRVLIW